jgi:outer membrane PBP1 activator LpoA protein
LSIYAPLEAQPLTTEPRTAPVANAMRSSGASTPQKRVVALLLPTEQPLLRRAAQMVRDGVRAVAAKAGDVVELRDCPYGGGGSGGTGGRSDSTSTAADAIALAYLRCAESGVDAIIGPLGRNDVAALAATKLPITRPTLLLSPSGAAPPDNFFVLAPDLESEAEAIARQSLEDACRKPMLIGTLGATSTRISVAIVAHYRSGGVATPLA